MRQPKQYQTLSLQVSPEFKELLKRLAYEQAKTMTEIIVKTVTEKYMK